MTDRFVFSDCDYALGKEEFFPSSFAFVFPEDSPYLPVFDTMYVFPTQRIEGPNYCRPADESNPAPVSYSRAQQERASAAWLKRLNFCVWIRPGDSI